MKSTAQTLVESVIGPVEDWEEHEPFKPRGERDQTIKFRTSEPVTFKLVAKLAEALGTDAINFYFGSEGEPGYSEHTPGTSASPGYIEIVGDIPNLKT